MANNRYISVYVRNQRYGPSDFYRVVQYLKKFDAEFVIHDALPDKLFRYNLDLCPSVKKKIIQGGLYLIICIRRFIALIADKRNKPEIIIVQREVFPRHIPKNLISLMDRTLVGSTVIWDFDDDIFEGEISYKEKVLLEKHSTHIVVTSNYLRDKLSEIVKNKVVIMPTSDDLLETRDIHDLIEMRKKFYTDKVRIAWAGTASSLKNLDMICGVLESIGLELKKSGRKLEFYVACNIKYHYNAENFVIVNVKWSRDKAAKIIMDSHIGIMPLRNIEYSKGKGGFKLIQYMSCGLPIIASAIGFNKEIISNEEYGFCCSSNEEWERALRILSTSESEWERYSLNSYHNYCMNFDIKNNERVWRDLLTGTYIS